MLGRGGGARDSKWRKGEASTRLVFFWFVGRGDACGWGAEQVVYYVVASFTFDVVC